MSWYWWCDLYVYWWLDVGVSFFAPAASAEEGALKIFLLFLLQRKKMIFHWIPMSWSENGVVETFYVTQSRWFSWITHSHTFIHAGAAHTHSHRRICEVFPALCFQEVEMWKKVNQCGNQMTLAGPESKHLLISFGPPHVGPQRRWLNTGITSVCGFTTATVHVCRGLNLIPTWDLNHTAGMSTAIWLV